MRVDHDEGAAPEVQRDEERLASAGARQLAVSDLREGVAREHQEAARWLTGTGGARGIGGEGAVLAERGHERNADLLKGQDVCALSLGLLQQRVGAILGRAPRAQGCAGALVRWGPGRSRLSPARLTLWRQVGPQASAIRLGAHRPTHSSRQVMGGHRGARRWTSSGPRQLTASGRSRREGFAAIVRVPGSKHIPGYSVTGRHDRDAVRVPEPTELRVVTNGRRERLRHVTTSGDPASRQVARQSIPPCDLGGEARRVRLCVLCDGVDPTNSTISFRYPASTANGTRGRAAVWAGCARGATPGQEHECRDGDAHPQRVAQVPPWVSIKGCHPRGHEHPGGDQDQRTWDHQRKGPAPIGLGIGGVGSHHGPGGAQGRYARGIEGGWASQSPQGSAAGASPTQDLTERTPTNTSG